MNLKRSLFILLTTLLPLTAWAQGAADKIVGQYRVEKDGTVSKVKIFKHENGYRAQVFWVEQMKNADGSPKVDAKNPDPSKRKTPSNQIVLIDKVVYTDNEWTKGKIYDPTSGKVYKVDLYFEKDGVLTVKGKLGPFYKKMYWKKIQ